MKYCNKKKQSVCLRAGARKLPSGSAGRQLTYWGLRGRLLLRLGSGKERMNYTEFRAANTYLTGFIYKITATWR